MKIIYRLISELFLIISPLIILYRVLKGKESKHRFFERYAVKSCLRNSGKLIWFHCSSVGELLSIVPIVEKFEANSKIKQILITTTTLSSSKIFESLKLKKSIHQFLPMDNKLLVNKFVNYWKPSVFFLCESEIWPNLIEKIKESRIKLILINGRMTKKSFKRWKKIKRFSYEIFGKFDLCLVQNFETQKRLKVLGVKKILNLGNLKFTTSKKIKKELLQKNSINYFKSREILLTAASTHFDEENFVIKNHLYFLKKNKNIISIIVPRHIERTNDIKKEIEKYSLKTHLHSSRKKIDPKVDIYIVDTYGELNKFFKISRLVFMGGSLINHGGQNPLEPAKFGCKIVHGPHIGNFKEIYSKLNKMSISEKFLNYNKGIKLVEKIRRKRLLKLNNKKILNYGQMILNSTYTQIIKQI